MPINPNLRLQDYRIGSLNDLGLQDKVIYLESTIGSGGGGASDFVDVTAAPYSAVGNGIANDAPAIALAIAAAAGKTLYFPPNKTFLLGAAVAIPTGMRIHGGANSVIRYASVIRNGFEVATTSDNVRVSGLRFVGDTNDDKDVNLGVAIYVNDGSTDVDIFDCEFSYCRPTQVESDNAQTGRFRFSGNRVLNAPLPVSTGQYSIITNNWFICTARVATRAQAIYLFGPMEGCLIYGNTFKNIMGQDIQIRAGSARFEQKTGFVIANNYFEHSGAYSIWAGSDTTLKASGYTITGNVLKNCSGGIHTQGLSESNISNNTLEWDWEYSGAMAGGAAGISSINGGTAAQRYGMPKSVAIHGNVLAQRHPYYGVLTMTTIPVAGTTITVGSTVYTWRAPGTASVVGDVEYSVGDIPDTLGRLQNAILGTNGDAYNAGNLNRIVRDASDVFYNGLTGLDPVTNKLIIVGRTTFTFSTTAVGSACAAVVDNRDSCQTAIICDFGLSPSIQNNHITDFKTAASMSHCWSPTFASNKIVGGSPVIGIANARSVYKNNHVADLDVFNTSSFQAFRQFLVKDAFPIFEGNGITCEQEYTTAELMGGSALVSAGDGKARCFLWYGSDQVGDGDVNTAPFSWRDGDIIEFRGTGKANLDCTFKRVAPGAGQFNSRASLMALINASADWRATAGAFVNVGGTADPGYLIELKMAVAGATDARVNVTTRAKTCGVVLYSEYTGDIIQQADKSITRVSYFLGGAAGATKTVVFSPLCSNQSIPRVIGVNAAARTLAPAIDLADIRPGVGAVITHAVATTEQFAVEFPSR